MAMRRTRLFEELITDLIMRGGHADTNACSWAAISGTHLKATKTTPVQDFFWLTDG
ncbi:hypothetical protein N658DRAFT_471423 [Parathielavia hyrcaniae]|uniref:Uncharacterized protein n=1 Tax=Parathielavia hyrcaniae TaxID=113614 RepID=A0AAN6T1P1_9PEZI|nr:hypothetical protein N658DRAFT_471423 [Parathielavia hyrcaniae]